MQSKSTMHLLITLMVSSVVPAAYCSVNVCPPGNAHHIHDVINLLGRSRAQEGIWHRIFCPEFRADEVLNGIVWYRGTSSDPRAVYIAGHFVGNIKKGRRYDFSTNYSLVIKGVEETDKGSYFCDVIPLHSVDRLGNVNLSVIKTRFPRVRNPTSTDRESFERRGSRDKLQCQCTTRAADTETFVVYWSTGEGVSANTDIIGARFAEGSMLQIQHGASYGIDDFSLKLNSLIGLRDEQRFWCHVLALDGTHISCYTDVTITGDQHPNDILKSSKSSFYFLNGKQAILPCMSWGPGDPACDVQWFKIDESDRHLLTYNLSTGNLMIEANFDLAENFGLLIKTVDESSAGRYRCDIDGKDAVGETIDVFVIGSKFPLDDGQARVHVGESKKVKLNKSLTISCPVRMSHTATKTHIFWSFGTPEQKSSTVIGYLVLPEGIKTMSDLGDNHRYDISNDGSLHMTSCSQDDVTRYWCHMFIEALEGYMLQRSYVDVTVSGTFLSVSAILVSIVFLIVAAFFIYLIFKIITVFKIQNTSG